MVALIDILFFVIAFCGFTVTVLYSKSAFILLRDGFRNKAAVVALGIVLGFTHITFNYTFWGVWYVYPQHREAMIENPFIPINVGLGILGALCHIRSATINNWKEWGWVSVLVSSIFGGTVLYLVT